MSNRLIKDKKPDPKDNSIGSVTHNEKINNLSFKELYQYAMRCFVFIASLILFLVSVILKFTQNGRFFGLYYPLTALALLIISFISVVFIYRKLYPKKRK